MISLIMIKKILCLIIKIKKNKCIYYVYINNINNICNFYIYRIIEL